MRKEQFIEIVKNLALDIFGSENNSNLSKSFIFYTLKKLVNNYQNYGDEIDNDILNSITDAQYDRGIDAVYIDDTREDYSIVYIIQGKFNNDHNAVNENSISQFINNYNQFPNISGKMNSILQNAISRYFQLKNDGVEVKKVGILLTLGNISNYTKSILDQNDIMIYDYDKINAEILIDEFLPNYNIELACPPSIYKGQDLLGFMDIKKLVTNENIRNFIRSEALFAYNIRGLMNNGRASVSSDIKETCLKNPESLFRKNNGITIICESFSKIDEMSYLLTRASVVNGQQTIKSIYQISDKLNHESNCLVPVKVSQLQSKNQEGIKKEILETAKSTNRQNNMKESDMKSNDYEQINIKEEAKTLIKPLKFIYINKRSFNNSKQINTITKEQAAMMISAFVNLNPSDRSETLFKNNYNKIFKDLKASHIAITNLLKIYIEKRHKQNDENRSGNSFWSEKIYIKFKKQRTINYCLYLLGLMLSEFHGFDDSEKRKILLDRLYSTMKKKSDYNVENYFSQDFWDIFNKICGRLIGKLYNNNSITSDFMRKPLDDKLEFLSSYNDVEFDSAESKKLSIKLYF